MNMESVLDVIANETKGKSYKTLKYSFEGIEVPRFDYDDNHKNFVWKAFGETDYEIKPTNMRPILANMQGKKPLFHYFLDGSRRVYKVDDIAYSNQVFPVIAGQVGVGCCVRENGNMGILRYKDGKSVFNRHIVVALPKRARDSDWAEENSFEYLRKKINELPMLKKYNITINRVESYSTSVAQGDKIENKGIAVIQDYMTSKEKEMVAELVQNKFLGRNRYLLKDGSLEYQVRNIKNDKELRRFQNNYQFVVGAAKSFNPANCKDKKDHNNSDLIAQLPLFYRTPVQMYESEVIGKVRFAIWFVRIRDRKFTNNAFDGILKLEKILVTDEEKENGLDSDEVDEITANIINERNPVCYGADKRWANHLYPIYVTERFIKSQYLGENFFLNLF